MFKNRQLSSFFKNSIISISMILISPSLLGFEGDEHHSLGEISIDIAIDYNCPDGSPQSKIINKKCNAIRSAASLLQNTAQDFSYGRINELVDYMHYPEQIFEHFNLKNKYPSVYSPEHPTDLNEHVLSLREDQINKLALFDYLSASSNNERHFQDALLESMHYLHKAAVTDAQQGHIYGALVKNALSDHFLNDFFAPGHITTARENSHDTVALAMHDRANKAGSCFQISKEQWGKLEPIFVFLKGSSHRIFINKKITDEKDIKKIVKNVNKCDVKVQDVGNFKKIVTKTYARDVQFRDVIINILSDNHDTLFLQGDGRLQHNPVQQLFMILVQVRSLSEVLQAYLHCENGVGSACNTPYITNYYWKGSYDFEHRDGTGIIAPEARTGFGQYNITYEPENEHANETVSFFFDRPKYAYPTIADNAWLMSFGGQSPYSQESSRFEFQLELFPLQVGTSNQWDFLRDSTIHRPSTECPFLCNLGFAYGLSYINDAYFQAASGQIRVIKVFPKISTLLSVNLRRGLYWGKEDTNTRTTYGIRYDHGFSLHSFYIGYQWDYGYDEQDIFHDENVITFGWTLTFPSSRLLGYFGKY